MKQKKTCGKNQHVRIDNIYRKANLICCRTDDAVEINLRYYILYFLDKNNALFYEGKNV